MSLKKRIVQSFFFVFLSIVLSFCNQGSTDKGDGDTAERNGDTTTANALLPKTSNSRPSVVFLTKGQFDRLEGVKGKKLIFHPMFNEEGRLVLQTWVTEEKNKFTHPLPLPHLKQGDLDMTGKNFYLPLNQVRNIKKLKEKIERDSDGRDGKEYLLVFVPTDSSNYLRYTLYVLPPLKYA